MVLAAPAAEPAAMTPSHTIDVSGLPPYEISNQAPLWLGQALLCVIEGSMFCMLIAMYFYLRLGLDLWPPPGVQLPHTLAPTLALIPLFFSCVGSYWASQAAKRDDRRWMLIGLSLNLLCAAIFLAFRFYEWRILNFTWAADVHGSIVWAILFLHTFDVIADLLMTAVLVVIIGIRRYAENQRLGVHVDSVVWYFLCGIWVPLYLVVYWGPHIVGAP